MHLYCMCQILVSSAINTIVTDIVQYQDIQTALGSWYEPQPLGSLYILIVPSISVTII
jgi:hypothetical protein